MTMAPGIRFYLRPQQIGAAQEVFRLLQIIDQINIFVFHERRSFEPPFGVEKMENFLLIRADFKGC